MLKRLLEIGKLVFAESDVRRVLTVALDGVIELCGAAAKKRLIEEFERDYLTRCLREAGGNISQAARTAGIDFKNFYEKMGHYGIGAVDFKRERAGS
jgi:DNA-binding NtrC family response regulator